MSNMAISRDEYIPKHFTTAKVPTHRETIITKAEHQSGEKNVIQKDDKEGADVPQSLSHELDDFIYQALPAGDYIRNLILEPSEEEDSPLFGSLEVFDLSQAGSGGSFEAISYAWGSGIKDQTITINGTQMSITTSLRDSLRQTRRPDRPRALWADAICINQGDDREKGHQVSLMGHIYKTSRCTLVCLGYSTESWPRQVTTLIADVEAIIDRVLAGEDPELNMDHGVFPWLNRDDQLLVDERWHAWAELVKQPWFERGWVVQETALSSECLVLWSSVKVSWIGILRVAIWIIRERNRIEALREEEESASFHMLHFPTLHLISYILLRPREASILGNFRHMTATASPLLENLDVARMLKLKDPKDRIYAFMALPTSDAAMPALHISYGKDISHLDVYRDFAIRYLAKNSNLDILAFAEHEDHEALATDPISCDFPQGQVCSAHTFPSWIPRWDRGPMATASGLIKDLNWRRIDLESQERWKVVDSSTLRVNAIVFDSVDFVSMVIQKPNRPGPEAVASVFSLWRNIAKQSSHPGDSHQSCLGSAEAFLVALCVGHLLRYLRWHPQGAVQALKTFAKLLEADWSEQKLSMDTHENDEDAQAIAITALNWSDRSRFLVLGRGYYAVSSAATRVGDVCAIISGTFSPFILREVAGKKDHYSLVGSAHVNSSVLTDEELPGRMGESERFDDWKEWNLPVRDISLC